MILLVKSLNFVVNFINNITFFLHALSNAYFIVIVIQLLSPYKNLQDPWNLEL